MEVIEERSSFLSNYEVLSLLKEEKQKLDVEKSSKGKYSNYRQLILTEQAIKYMEDLPFSKLTDNKFLKIMQKLKAYELVKIEKLQILNILPNSAPLYSPIIENLMERFKVLAFEEGEEEDGEENNAMNEEEVKRPILEDLIDQLESILSEPEESGSMQI
ncbi:hypothetical protein CONCODRAFT_78392 [Conidiobolus coronatus NRRL 28638]|uniref:DNA-directed RNA polymerase III subunit RPC9 n=1 Tax=Conidiobolus coronatus (strain ATCC 28846 / CBS 209.66 / NRRL 28638) TaxID=796925 RepID=A0A137P8S4_CONC2|nr:hypothetical protein CONCODRAFT_78392 [Conidiobolus coronatus NRRL 28638]|eukprot:KXN71321.1 hypothetical protein CONCODRAFT_78392 [Conidiobolus coronatus NRRL 28638]